MDQRPAGTKRSARSSRTAFVAWCGLGSCGWKKNGPSCSSRTELEAWLDEVTESDWNVFIEGPPHGKSRPEHVLKYLARYMTGGPISDRRIISDENDHVTFWARSKDKAAGNPSRPFELPGKEFVRRWSMHILPKGYTRSRQFGGYHGSKRKDYLPRCRELLTIASPPPIPPPERIEPSPPECPRCKIVMRCILTAATSQLEESLRETHL